MSIRVLKYKKGTTYQAAVRVQGRRLTQCFDRRADAERWLRSHLNKRDLGELQIRDFPVFREVAEQWFSMRVNQLASTTFALTKHYFESDVLPKLGHMKLEKIEASHVYQVVNGIRDRGLSERTANIVLAAIRKLFTDSSKMFGFKVQNPALDVPRFKERPKSLDYWSAEEAKAFLATAEKEDHWTYPLFCFLLHTGVRVGEAFSLQWRDVDFERGSVCIQRTVDRIHRVSKDTTKGNKLRHVGLSSGLLAQLHGLRQRSRDGTTPESLVFPNTAGKLHHPSRFQRSCFDSLVKKSGVKRIRIHDIRHTFAAHFVMNGGSIYDLKAILGHSDIKMTERYAHLAPNYLLKRMSLVSFAE